MTAPKAVPKAISMVSSATPSTSSTMDKAKMLMMIRMEILNRRDERKFAFTAANSAARAKKLAAKNPKKRMTKATKNRGKKRKKRDMYSCSPAIPSTLMPRRMKPTHATQKTRRLTSSVDDGSAARFNNRVAPAFSESLEKLVRCRMLRASTFNR